MLDKGRHSNSFEVLLRYHPPREMLLKSRYLTSKLFLERLKSHVADTYEGLFIFRIVNVVLSVPFL